MGILSPAQYRCRLSGLSEGYLDGSLGIPLGAFSSFQKAPALLVLPDSVSHVYAGYDIHGSKNSVIVVIPDGVLGVLGSQSGILAYFGVLTSKKFLGHQVLIVIYISESPLDVRQITPNVQE